MKQYTLKSGIEQLNAFTASGVVVKVNMDMFLNILSKSETSIVISSSQKGLFSEYYQYLAFYKGVALYAESKKSVTLPQDIELIEAEKIWTPY